MPQATAQELSSTHMLSSGRNRAVKDLVIAALRCEPTTRVDFIREASHGDTALSDEALTLLKQVLEGGDSGALPETQLLGSSSESIDSRASYRARSVHEFKGNARFDVRRMLGAGGFGEVYETYDRDQHQVVALKVLRRADPAVLFRFKREFRALVDVRHRHLVELYELFCDDELWFFTMELVRGVNFLSFVERPKSEAIAGRTACDVDRLRVALAQLSEGIGVLHARGILHRDIKPANVLVSDDGCVKLLDFGLVRETESSSMHSVMVAGTPAYMSPERFALLPSDTPSDWFSVGVVLYQALTGSVPTRGFNQEVAASHIALLRDVPHDLEQLCLALLDPDPAKRPTGMEIRDRLGAATSKPQDVPVAVSEEVLVGREHQLAALANLVGVTKQGRAVVVNLYGPSGIGKTTLLRTFRRRLAHERDVVVLMGHCHENETVPFKALDDLIDHLSQYLSALPAGELDAVAPRDAASLIRVFPILAQVDGLARGKRRSLDIVDAQELRRRAFASLQDLLARLAERRTLVVAIDDVQWGDLDSAAFLRALFIAAAPPSLLLIASYRAEDADTSPFLKAWRSQLETTDSFLVEHVALAELTPDESEELATRLMPPAAGATSDAARAIARESGGSPFLIEQFARYAPRDAMDPAGLNIRRAVAVKLEEMPAPARQLLETLAIATQPLSEAVALAAAAFEAGNRPAVARLAAEHFVRVRETSDSRQIEIYHDRLRKIIVASMSPDTLRQRHRALATVLQTLPSVDPAVLSIHYRECGDVTRAAEYAIATADQASNALAFERAATWYAAALEHGALNRDESVGLQRKLAEALAFAGRGPAAADAYLKAAEAADPQARPELRRLAAEQLLRSGHVDQGLAVLEDTGRELGVWIPGKRWQILLSLAVHRLRAALPAFGFRRQPSSDLAAPRLMILDVYWSFFIGLGNFDPIRAMDFHARHLVLAARVGDPKRRALSLAAEAVTRAVSGGESAPSAALIEKARTLCDGLDAPNTLGFIATMEALCACMAGQWRRALSLADRAEHFLSEECSGVAWERATSIQVRSTGVFHLGQWATEYGVQRFPAAIAEARARGDVHAMVAHIPAGTMAFLVADEPVLAEQFIRDTIAALPRNRFLMPNVYVFALKVYVALYTGDARTAWSIVDSEWSTLTASHFLRVEYLAVAALDVRARAAIALAVDGDPSRLDDARRCARRLSRKHSRWGRAVSLLIRAGIESIRRQPQATVDFLERAEREFEAADMAHYVAACRYRRGSLIGQDDGRALVSAAEAWATAEAVANPQKIFDMLAPGLWTASRIPQRS